MDRVKFEMNVGLKDVRGLMLTRLLASRFIRFYYIFVIALSLLLFLTGSDSYDRSDYENLCIFIVIGLLFPFLFGWGFATAAFKRSKKQGKKLFFIDREGFGSEANTHYVFFKWKSFDAIHETEKYILLKKDGWSRFAIYKYLLPDETVSSIKEILTGAPIQNKKMLPDEKSK